MRFSGRGEINDEEDDIFALKKEQSLFVNFKIIGGQEMKLRGNRKWVFTDFISITKKPGIGGGSLRRERRKKEWGSE